MLDTDQTVKINSSSADAFTEHAQLSSYTTILPVNNTHIYSFRSNKSFLPHYFLYTQTEINIQSTHTLSVPAFRFLKTKHTDHKQQHFLLMSRLKILWETIVLGSAWPVLGRIYYFPPFPFFFSVYLLSVKKFSFVLFLTFFFFNQVLIHQLKILGPHLQSAILWQKAIFIFAPKTCHFLLTSYL